jgi:hypothetical protein
MLMVTAIFTAIIAFDMKVVLLLITFCFAFMFANSQYYFTDIVSHRQSDFQYKLLQAAKVKQVKAVSYGPDDKIMDGFGLEQNIIDGGRKIVTQTLMPNSGTTIIENTYDSNKLISSVNSVVQPLSTVSTITTYTYSSKGAILSIVSSSLDTITASAGNYSEKHIWQYNENNAPTQMLKIKNNKDTLLVLFSYDDKGTVAEEKWMKKGKEIEHYYYYYNEDGLLTDVVRFNPSARKLLPDFVYEYDDNASIIKMIQPLKGGTEYLTWKYTYNDNGLKTTETCFNKKKEVEGKVVYEYSY